MQHQKQDVSLTKNLNPRLTAAQSSSPLETKNGYGGQFGLDKIDHELELYTKNIRISKRNSDRYAGKILIGSLQNR